MNSKTFWIDILNSWFKDRAKQNYSGENNIQAVYGRGDFKGQIIAWKCVFPKEFKLKSKQFGFKSENESKIALKLSIEYRDSSIKNFVDSIRA